MTTWSSLRILLLVKSAALVRAAELLGGAVPLARRLQVPMPELTRWLAGNEIPSMGTFLKVIDILLEDSRGFKSGPPEKGS